MMIYPQKPIPFAGLGVLALKSYPQAVRAAWPWLVILGLINYLDAWFLTGWPPVWLTTVFGFLSLFINICLAATALLAIHWTFVGQPHSLLAVRQEIQPRLWRVAVVVAIYIMVAVVGYLWASWLAGAVGTWNVSFGLQAMLLLFLAGMPLLLFWLVTLFVIPLIVLYRRPLGLAFHESMWRVHRGRFFRTFLIYAWFAAGYYAVSGDTLHMQQLTHLHVGWMLQLFMLFVWLPFGLTLVTLVLHGEGEEDHPEMHGA